MQMYKSVPDYFWITMYSALFYESSSGCFQNEVQGSAHEVLYMWIFSAWKFSPLILQRLIHEKELLVMLAKKYKDLKDM